MKEIGSEFWNVPISDKENCIFPIDTHWFISGTAALESIIIDIMATKRIVSAALPSWCCNCMVTPFLKHGISVVYYPVYMKDSVLTCDYSAVSADCWLLISYFGYTSQVNVGEPTGVIIRDVTHSIFSKTIEDADYYFGSLRKWAGFYTGGYAWSEGCSLDNPIPACDEAYVALRKSAMDLKKTYIQGETESKNYLALFEQGEDYLDHCDPMQAYTPDIELAQHLNTKAIKEQRRKNASVLLDSLKTWAIFPEVREEDCPLFVPILLEQKKRDALRNYLKLRNIYCPIHWSVDPEHRLTELTADLYEREISIVCDQRYNENDMLLILKTIKESKLL